MSHDHDLFRLLDGPPDEAGVFACVLCGGRWIGGGVNGMPAPRRFVAVNPAAAANLNIGGEEDVVAPSTILTRDDQVSRVIYTHRDPLSGEARATTDVRSSCVCSDCAA